MNPPNRPHIFLPLLLPAALLPVLLVLGICAGSFWIPPAELLHISNVDPVIDPVADLRLIRMLTALTVGGSLALSGMVFQAVLRNPLAEPFILGVSGGAGVGAALAIITGLAAVSVLSLPLCALAGALVSFGVVLAISRRGHGRDNLLLSGVIVGTLAGSILMFLISIAKTDALAGITWWMLGDLQTADTKLLIPAGIVLVRPRPECARARRIGSLEPRGRHAEIDAAADRRRHAAGGMFGFTRGRDRFLRADRAASGKTDLRLRPPETHSAGGFVGRGFSDVLRYSFPPAVSVQGDPDRGSYLADRRTAVPVDHQPEGAA